MGSFRFQPLHDTIEEELRVWASSLLASALAESMGGKAYKTLLVMLRLNSESGQLQINALADRARSIAGSFDDQDLAERISRAAYQAKTLNIVDKGDDFRALVPALALSLLDDADTKNQVVSDHFKVDALKLLMFTERRLWKKSPMSAKELTMDHKALGRKGGQAKNAMNNALKNWTLEIWRAGKWPSKRDAAKKLLPKVVEQGAQFGVFFSPANAERTIYDWIRSADK